MRTHPSDTATYPDARPSRRRILSAPFAHSVPGGARILQALVLLAATVCLSGELRGQFTWSGGGANAAYTNGLNWQGGQFPSNNTGQNIVFPAGATAKSVLVDVAHGYDSQVVLEGGFDLQAAAAGSIPNFSGPGTILVRGFAAGYYSSGDNSIGFDFGSYGTPSPVTFQSLGGTFTVRGNVFDPNATRDFTLQGDGGFRFTGRFAMNPSTGAAASGFYHDASGTTVFEAGSALTGAAEGRFIQAGTLIFNGTTDGVGDWVVDGGRLGGVGTLESDLDVGSTDGSILAPGDPVDSDGLGTLTINGNASFGDFGSLSLEAGGGGADTLVVNGDLTVGERTTLYVDAVGSLSGDYVLVSYSGTFSGEFEVLDLPEGSVLDTQTAGEIRLVSDPVVAEPIDFPDFASSGVINVTNLPASINNGVSAVPDDGVDDTAAIQAALFASINENRIIYLPNGTYDVSDTLFWPYDTDGTSPLLPYGEKGKVEGTRGKRAILQGESKNGTILRLNDNNPDFAAGARVLVDVIDNGDGTTTDVFRDGRPVLFTGVGPAQRFRNSIRNLTVNTGSGNPGARGIQFYASNQGTVRGVKIISEDRAGLIGLDLNGNENGPLMVRDLEVVGFDEATASNAAINGIVMEDVRIEDQNLRGLNVTGQVTSINGLVSINDVPAVYHGDPDARDGSGGLGGVPRGGMLTLLDATLIGYGGAVETDAIVGQGFFYGRDIRATGYDRLYSRTELSGEAVITEPWLDEGYTAPDRELFASTPESGSFKLDIAPLPEVPWGPLTGWVSVADHGATFRADDDAAGQPRDDTAAIQAAIDSGAETVYFPAGGSYTIEGDVVLRGNVRRLIGLEGTFDITGGSLTVADGTAPTVVIERLDRFPTIDIRSDRAVVIRNSRLGAILSSGSGDLFIEDVVTDEVRFFNSAQHIWARQLDTEGKTSTNIINDGATLWLLGFKTEQGETKIDTRNGGITEVLGANVFDNVQPDPATPLFRIHEASASFAGVATADFDGTSYVNAVEETRNGVTKTLLTSDLSNRTSANGKVMSLFRGYSDLSPNRAPEAVDDSTSVEEGSSVLIEPLLNDSDPDGDPLLFAVTVNPAFGTLQDNGDGTVTYTPDAGYAGSDQFAYEIDDGGFTDSATVWISVTVAPEPADTTIRYDFESFNANADIGDLADASSSDAMPEGDFGLTAGRKGYAGFFDGNGDYLVIDHSAEMEAANGTFALWIKPNVVDHRMELFSKDAKGFGTGGHVTAYLDPNGLHVRLQSSTKTHTVSHAVSLSDEAWRHVAFSFGADGMRLYLDGAEVDTNAYTGGLDASSGGTGNFEPIVLGGNTWISDPLSAYPINANHDFSGMIDDFRFYDRQLFASELSDLITAADGEPTPVWDFLNTPVDQALTIPVDDLLENDFFRNDRLITLAVVGEDLTQGSTLTLQANGDLLYQPAAGFVGVDRFTYELDDEVSTSALTATVEISVGAVALRLIDIAFDEPLGTTGDAPDFSGFLNDASLVSGATHVTGKVFNAVDFDGIDDHAVIGHSAELEPSEGTLAFWVKADDLGTDRFFLSKDSMGFDNGGHLSIYHTPTGGLTVRLQDQANSYLARSNIQLTAGGWHHVAFRFGHTGMKLFLDGSPVAVNGYLGGMVGNLEPIVLGANSWDSADGTAYPLFPGYHDGSIDELRFFDRALSDAEIADMASN